ncbi:hypothetical protein QE152_g29994 [Popillia japonica]|uniref:Integrase catalytic domain-containing protein n=1 Tax=Popillia japonica TaxID=7064 RepID=A0AAW1JG00_POPJA
MTEDHQRYPFKLPSKLTEYIKKCEVCQRNKYDRRPPKVPFQITEQIDKPFSKIHIDTIAINSQNFLTIIDVFTKYAQAYPINGKTAVEIVEKLIESFSIHGTPQVNPNMGNIFAAKTRFPIDGIYYS